MPKNLIKVPKNPLASKRNFNRATEGKLKLYPYRRRGLSISGFFADSMADVLFHEHINDEIDDMMNIYYDRDY